MKLTIILLVLVIAVVAAITLPIQQNVQGQSNTTHCADAQAESIGYIGDFAPATQNHALFIVNGQPVEIIGLTQEQAMSLARGETIRVCQ